RPLREEDRRPVPFEEPGMKISEFALSDEPDQARDRADLAALLLKVNRTRSSYPRHKTVSRVFAERATGTPDATAVISGDDSFTHGEFEERSGALARSLWERGRGRGARVAIMLERPPAAVVAMLGTMKAGGAYLPLGPGLPFDRMKHLLRD